MSTDKERNKPMVKSGLSVRLAEENDHVNIVDYFLDGDNDFHLGMGVDSAKLPAKKAWLQMLSDNHKQPLENKSFYYLIWLSDNTAIGHSNINKIAFGEEAYVHLHMWRGDKRQAGLGLEFMKMCLPYYFNHFNLKKLYCEPYALNPAPNKILKKLGFDFLIQYETTPGWISFHQQVNRWLMDLNKYQSLYS